MMLRLVTLFCVCVGLVCVESRFLKSSFRADTSQHTSISEGWRKFWQHMESEHSDMKLDFKRRVFKGAGVVGAAYYVPSTETERPGKIVKVRFDPSTNNPREYRHAEVVEDLRNSKMVSDRLHEFGTRFGSEKRGKWLHHFVKGSLHHTTPHGSETGYLFEVMDFVQGISFEDYIASGLSNQTPERLRHIIRQLLEVLYVLKEARIIHGDLHPGNVLIQENGQLFVIDMDGSRLCQNVEKSAARPMFIPYDSFSAHRKQANKFTSIDEDSCIAFDAYSIGVGMVSGVTMKVVPLGETSPFYYRKIVLDWLVPNVDPMLLHLRNDVSTRHGHSHSSLPPVLYRILTALLDEHRAPRTAATLAMLDQVLLKEFSTVTDAVVEFDVEETVVRSHNPENGLPPAERDEQEDKHRGKAENTKKAKDDTTTAKEEDSTTAEEDTATAKEEEEDGQPTHRASNPSAGYIDTDMEAAPVTTKKELENPFEYLSKKTNGLTKYMEDLETNARSFPPGGPIVTRKGKPLHSYVPNMLFRNGLHAATLEDTNSKIQVATLYNIFQLQLVYRQKLVLQLVDEADCQHQTAPTSRGRATWDSPVLLSVDRQVPSEEAHTAKTIFEFDGQPLRDVLNHLHHDKGVNRVHASLMNWDNHVIVGGCLRAVRESESGSIRYEIGSSTRYSLVVVGEAESSLELHVPSVLVVGGGPMGLVAAIEARRSAATVTIWEKRDSYTRMYCQACEVSSVVERFGLKTEQYLKSVEETLSCVAIAVGVNLQFQREFLYVDKNVAIGKRSGDTWFAKASTPWAELRQKFGAEEASVLRLRIDMLIAADGSGSSVRKQYMSSEFADAKQVVFKSDTSDVYRQRVMRPKDNKPIYSLATLQFFRASCEYLSSHCIRHDTGFDLMWSMFGSYGSLCFVEYIENWIGLQHIENDILGENALPGFSTDGPDVWSQIRRHQQNNAETEEEKSAMQAFDELMFARYLSSMPGIDKANNMQVRVRNEKGGRCSLTRVTEDATVTTDLETFRSWRKPDVYSIFWMRARRAETDKFAVSKDGVTAILVGDATRDSFFPFGNGLSEHIKVLTDELKTQASSESSQASVVGPSILGALLRGQIGVSEYNAHYETAIAQYIHGSSRALLLLTACTNEESNIKETAGDRRVRITKTVRGASLQTVQTLCPGLDVTDT